MAFGKIKIDENQEQETKWEKHENEEMDKNFILVEIKSGFPEECSAGVLARLLREKTPRRRPENGLSKN